MAVVRGRPEIVVVYIIIGDCNYIPCVQVPNLQHYSELIIERLYKMPGMVDIRSNIVLRAIKDRDGDLTLSMEARNVCPLEDEAAGKDGRAE